MYYCIDFESTGAVNGQEPLEFAWVKVNSNGKVISFREVGFTSVSGGRDLSDIEEKVSHLRDLWPEINSELQGAIIVGHNVNYDCSLLTKTFPGFKPGGTVDTLTIYRQLYGNQILSYSLESLLDIFDLKQVLDELQLNEHFEPHRALYDAYGCALLLSRLLESEETRKIFEGNSRQGELF